MKLFVWKMLWREGKYINYEGMVLALAETEKEARKLIVSELNIRLNDAEKEDREKKLNYLRGYLIKKGHKLLNLRWL